MYGPNPDDKYPMKGFHQVGFLKNFISNPNISVGNYTYYDNPGGPEKFETDNVLYHFPFIGDKLIIGKFCAIGKDVKFIMNGANHKMNGFSAYPFQIFGNGWDKFTPPLHEFPYKGNTVLENDVWLGYDCQIMPGIKIGNGAIIASKAVVAHDVDAYTVVAGNPARQIKKRFPDDIVDELLKIAWWNWDIKLVSENLDAIMNSDIERLKAIQISL